MVIKLFRQVSDYIDTLPKEQSQKAPRHEIETAIRRMKDILENLK